MMLSGFHFQPKQPNRFSNIAILFSNRDEISIQNGPALYLGVLAFIPISRLLGLNRPQLITVASPVPMLALPSINRSRLSRLQPCDVMMPTRHARKNCTARDRVSKICVAPTLSRSTELRYDMQRAPSSLTESSVRTQTMH